MCGCLWGALNIAEWPILAFEGCPTQASIAWVGIFFAIGHCH